MDRIFPIILVEIIFPIEGEGPVIIPLRIKSFFRHLYSLLSLLKYEADGTM
jgi:hypothetical protein